MPATAYIYAPFTGSVGRRDTSNHCPCTDGQACGSAMRPMDLLYLGSTNINAYVSFSTIRSVSITDYLSGTAYECCDQYSVSDNLHRATVVRLYKYSNRVGYIGYVLYGHLNISNRSLNIDSNGNLNQNYVGRLGSVVTNETNPNCYTGYHLHMEVSVPGQFYNSGTNITVGATPIYYFNFDYP